MRGWHQPGRGAGLGPQDSAVRRAGPDAQRPAWERVLGEEFWFPGGARARAGLEGAGPAARGPAKGRAY